MPPNEQQLLENFRDLPAVEQSQVADFVEFLKARRSAASASQPQSLLTQLNQVYAQESSALDPAIAALQYASLPREDW